MQFSPFYKDPNQQGPVSPLRLPGMVSNPANTPVLDQALAQSGSMMGGDKPAPGTGGMPSLAGPVSAITGGLVGGGKQLSDTENIAKTGLETGYGIAGLGLGTGLAATGLGPLGFLLGTGLGGLMGGGLGGLFGSKPEPPKPPTPSLDAAPGRSDPAGRRFPLA